MRNISAGRPVYRLVMLRRPLILTFAAVVAVALLAAGCPGGNDEPSGDNGDAGDAASDIVAASVDALGEARSFEIEYEIRRESGGFEYSEDGRAGYESGELAYSQMTVSGGQDGSEEVTELLLLPPDMYLRPDGSEGWYVQSPWNQGIRPDEMPEGGLGAQLLDYESIIKAMENVERLPDATIEGVEYVHLLADAKPEELAGDDEGARKALEDADGGGEVELWLEVEGYLPYVVQVDTDVEIGWTRVFTTVEYRFLQYGAAVSLPEPPAEARPYRDLMFPEAACTGSQFEACLEAQTALQAGSSASCEGSGRRICLVPLGQVSPALVSHLVEQYRDQYGLTVSVLTPAAVPVELVDPLRQQADAGTLIDYFGSLFPGDYADPEAVLIGLTAVDLYDKTSHFRYLFGLKGTFEYHPKAIVSVFRMSPEFYGEAPDQELFYERSRKLFTRYVGVLYYGLPPSEDPRSLMFEPILGPDDLDMMEEPLPVQ